MGNDSTVLSVRVDRDLKQRLDAESHLNTSGVVRELLENYTRMGDAVEVGLKRRLNDKEDELRQLRLKKEQVDHEIGKVEREIEELQEKIKKRHQSVPEEVIEFTEGIKSGRFSRQQLEVENAAVQNWSQKAGIRPDEFIREVEARL